VGNFPIKLLIKLITGMILRIVIVSHIKSSSARQNTINTLIWIEQLVGIFFFINLIFWILVLTLPFPIKSVMGSSFCRRYTIVGHIRVCGNIVWGLSISLYRILYIKAQKFVKYFVGEKRLLIIVIMCGIFLHMFLSCLMAYVDDASLAYRICIYTTAYELETTRLYKVSYFLTLVFGNYFIIFFKW